MEKKKEEEKTHTKTTNKLLQAVCRKITESDPALYTALPMNGVPGPELLIRFDCNSSTKDAVFSFSGESGRETMKNTRVGTDGKKSYVTVSFAICVR